MRVKCRLNRELSAGRKEAASRPAFCGAYAASRCNRDKTVDGDGRPRLLRGISVCGSRGLQRRYFFMLKHLFTRSLQEFKSAKTITPVSYTHLDVYKRQENEEARGTGAACGQGSFSDMSTRWTDGFSGS